jgi:hypothetical protein
MLGMWVLKASPFLCTAIFPFAPLSYVTQAKALVAIKVFTWLSPQTLMSTEILGNWRRIQGSTLAKKA